MLWIHEPPAVGQAPRRRHRLSSPTLLRRHTRAAAATAPHAASALPLPEGSMGLPLVGETLDLLRDGNSFGAKRCEQYGPLWKTNILGAPTVMVYDDSDVRAVLAADGSTVEAWWPPGTAELVGPRSLNLLTPPRHPGVKSAFTRAFGEPAVTGAYLSAVARAAATVLDAWVAATSSAAAAPAGPVGAPTTAKTAAAALGDMPAGRRALSLCDVIASATFHAALLGSPPSPSGAAADAETAAAAAALVKAAVDRAALAAALTGGFTPPMLDAPFTAFGRARRARQALLAEYASALKAALSSNEIGGRPAASTSALAATAIESLAQAMTGSSSSSGGGGGALSAARPTEEEVLDGVFACLFGNAGAGPTMVKLLQYIAPPAGLASTNAQDQGNGSGANAAAATVWWERLREEQRAVVAAMGPKLNAAALDAMPLAEAAVREALRMSPVVPAMFRRATADFEIRGRRIPAGWRVWLHTGPGVLRYNQDEFDPARWLSADGEGGTGSGASPSGQQQQQQEEEEEEEEGEEGEEGRGAGGSACPFAGLAAGGRAGGGNPFGGGVRACVGRPLMLAQLRLILALLIRRYRWSSAAGAGEPWVVVPAPRPAQGLAGFELGWLPHSEVIPLELGE